ncbi:cell envelope integrity protein CreD [Rurimicrobium arvi]|uniref:Cell envelope integrity protein CreD n=1 Tax=Rurimicrobium arvi TaxID=2049916 RepID=A0ABP8MEW3_9BACT
MDTHIPSKDRTPSFWENNRLLIKSILLAALTLIMLIPAAFIRDLVYERQSRQQEVTDEVSSKWAASQTIKGPLVMVPYLAQEVRPDKSVINVKKFAFIMPDQLRIHSTVNTETRHRSIYEVLLYTTNLSLEADFKPADLLEAGILPQSVYENEVRLLMGVSDVRGLVEDIHGVLNNTELDMDAGMPANGFVHTGLSKPISWDRKEPLHVGLSLKLRGSTDLNFIPLGKNTKVTVSSPWKHPSFEGKFLPSESVKPTEQGFTADWNVLQVSSGIPTLLTDQPVNVDALGFGVRFIRPADGYAKTQRAVKYALLFIGLTFTVFFFMEILRRRQVHPLQYLLVGMALCVFYTLLLSFTEYIGFNFAYILSAAATASLIACYIWSVFKSPGIGFSFGGALALLYAYILVLIQLEDLALLFGSVGLFVVLAVIMYYSRKIDWYSLEKQKA